MKEDKRMMDQLAVHIFDTREAMGKAAAADAASRIRRILDDKGHANIVFAAAPSQNDLIAGLLNEDIDWSRIRAFQQDEYIGISEDEPAGFGSFLKEALYRKVPLMEAHYLLTDSARVQEKIQSYGELLTQFPPDLMFLGVGENGHLAFNDPPVADFDDPHMIKVVELDPICRQQQVNDGCFPGLAQVPEQALTLTLSFIRSVPDLICVVPTSRKAEAIREALLEPISTQCPASMLRKLPGASLYLDRDSAALAFPEA